MQIEDPLPAPETWWGSIAAAVSLVMARIASYFIAGFAAYGAAMHPESLWTLGEHVDGDDPSDAGTDEYNVRPPRPNGKPNLHTFEEK
jgi:hypothetical protein